MKYLFLNFQSVQRQETDQFYKDASLWWIIVASNPGKLRRDSYFCKPGMQIRIPLDPEPVIKEFDRLNSSR